MGRAVCSAFRTPHSALGEFCILRLPAVALSPGAPGSKGRRRVLRFTLPVSPELPQLSSMSPELSGGFYRFLGPISHSFHPCHMHTFMLVTIFPRLWRGICAAFTAENAEHAEKGGNGGNGEAAKTAQPSTQRAQSTQRGDWGKKSLETGTRSPEGGRRLRQGPSDSAALRSHRFRSASLRAGRASSGTEAGGCQRMSPRPKPRRG